MDGSFKLNMKDSYLDKNDLIHGIGFNAQVASSPITIYESKMKTEKRLPRKKKKWLKKYGGWEYYLQVPSKVIYKPATIDDFNEVMNIMTNRKNEPYNNTKKNG